LIDDWQQEKAILLAITAALLVIVVILLRYTVLSEDGQTAGMFKMLTVITLALVSFCVYRYVKLLSPGNR
jgi:hypothetical protein